MRSFAPKNLSLDGKSIFVTGGTGSFGKHFISKVITDYKPARVVVFSRDELKQYEGNPQIKQTTLLSSQDTWFSLHIWKRDDLNNVEKR